MATKYTRGDWKRLGTAVLAARLRRKDLGLDNTGEWADAIGRSSRVALGLERGEPAGPKTLRVIEEVLHWPTGYCDVILSDPNADPEPDAARPLAESLEYHPEPRPLDEYTTVELLTEIENRFVDMALELNNLGHPAVTTRSEGHGTIIEAMSPATRRLLERGGQATRRAVNGDTDDETRA